MPRQGHYSCDPAGEGPRRHPLRGEAPRGLLHGAPSIEAMTKDFRKPQRAVFNSFHLLISQKGFLACRVLSSPCARRTASTGFLSSCPADFSDQPRAGVRKVGSEGPRLGKRPEVPIPKITYHAQTNSLASRFELGYLGRGPARSDKVAMLEAETRRLRQLSQSQSQSQAAKRSSCAGLGGRVAGGVLWAPGTRAQRPRLGGSVLGGPISDLTF